jgi:methylthioribose-1-phosphate isomerase
MDWTQIILAVIAAIGAAGGVGGIVQIREAKRAKKIENDKAAADEWKELYNSSEAKCDNLGKKLDEIYTLLRNEQERRQGVEIALARAELCRCDKLNCIDREPPFGGGAAKTA